MRSSRSATDRLKPRLAVLAALLCALSPAATASAAPTGRLLVLLEHPGARATASAAAAVVSATGARHAGPTVPQIGLVTVRPRPGESLRALAARLRSDPRVASVQAEGRFTHRDVPNDPALSTDETFAGTPSNTPVEWWAGRENLPAAWDISHGDGAVVAVIDSGVDASHPEFTGRIKDTVDLDPSTSDGPATSDSDGHGTHVASLACATANNGIGIAGAGYDCSLLIIKSDLSDASVAQSIVAATDRGADAINMSFGQDGRAKAPEAEQRAIDYAYAHHVTMVAAAADDAVTEQGDPANALQPTGTGPMLGSGKGLSVTAADFDGRRPSFAGYGSQISLAAYGTFHYGGGLTPSGPPGLLGAFPSGLTSAEIQGCGCRTSFQGDSRYAYLQGTSMAAPMVAAIAALAHHLNPDLSAHDVIRIIEQTATRPAGTGWTSDLGWGILNGGAALAAARDLDRTRPVSRLRAPLRVRGHRRFVLRWTGRDPAPAGLTASGVARYEVWRSLDGHAARRIATTRHRSLRLRAASHGRYAFFTIAIDRAGNREVRPAHPDARTRVVR